MSHASPLHERLTAAVLERDEENGWDRRQIDNPRRVIEEEGTYFIGGSKVTDVGNSRKWVADTIYPVTSGELAREYLRGCMGAVLDEVKPSSMLGRGIIPKSRGSYTYLADTRPPLYYLAQDEDPRGPWAYVDLTAAYFSLYRVCALDMRYKRGEYLGRGHVNFLAEAQWGLDKRARNAVFGCVTSAQVTMIRNSLAYRIKTKRDLLAPDLVGYMLDTMHAVAQEAVNRFGAALWLIDAGAVRPEQAEPMIEWLWKEWGLTGRIVDSGPGYLWNIYDYQIGGRLTKRLQRLQVRRSGPRNSIRNIDESEIAKLRGWREWLLANW